MKKSNKILYFSAVISALLLFAFGNTTQSTLLNQFTDYYAIDSSKQSYISSVISAGMFLALCLMLFGFIRFRRSCVLISAAAVATVFFYFLSLMPGFNILLVCYFFIGISYGMIDTAASSVTADLFSGQSATRYMGLLHSFFGIGGVCGPLVIQQLLIRGNLNWHIILRVFAAAAFAVLLYSLIVYLKLKSELDIVIGPTPELSFCGLKTYLNKRNTMLMLAIGFKGAQEVCLAFWLARYITVGFSSPALGPLAISLMWLGSSVSRLTIPALPIKTDKYIIYSMFGSAAVLIVSLVFPSALLMCAASLTTGLTSGAVVPAGLSELCSRCPGNTLLASSCTLMCVYIGQAMLPFTAGLLFSDLLTAGIIMAVVCGLLGGLFALVSYKIKTVDT